MVLQNTIHYFTLSGEYELLALECCTPVSPLNSMFL